LSTPVARLFQIHDRIFYSGLLNGATVAFLVLSNWLMVFVFHLDVLGLTIAQVLRSLFALAFGLALLARLGTSLDIGRLIAFLGIGAGVGALAIGAITLVPKSSQVVVRLLVDGAVFVGAVAFFYWPFRQKIRFILHGEPYPLAPDPAPVSERP